MCTAQAAGVAVMDERDIGARSALGKRHPECVEDEVGAHVGCELHQVGSAQRQRIGLGCPPRLAATLRPDDPVRTHQPLHPAARHLANLKHRKAQMDALRRAWMRGVIEGAKSPMHVVALQMDELAGTSSVFHIRR